MTLSVIGSGLGRTGTKSLQTALNMLGVGPCHHMVEVFQHPETVPLWIAAGQGKPDWEAIFAGYGSAVDYPSAAHWRELAAYYPQAKVIHTVRDPDKWFDSTQATIFSANAIGRMDSPLKPFFESFLGEAIHHITDRAWMTDHFRRHTEAVKAAIPAERLLIYEAGQGWEPICDFLGVPVPAEPYPSENDRAAFQARMAAGAQSPLARQMATAPAEN